MRALEQHGVSFRSRMYVPDRDSLDESDGDVDVCLGCMYAVG